VSTATREGLPGAPRHRLSRLHLGSPPPARLALEQVLEGLASATELAFDDSRLAHAGKRRRCALAKCSTAANSSH
jgi:hypothetical protein